jgi:hypothetical protein
MTNSPIDTLRDGRLKATIWKNFGDNGNFYTVTLSRSYQDEADNWQDSDSFSGSELLRIAHLASRAYDRVSELRSIDRKELAGTAANG